MIEACYQAQLGYPPTPVILEQIGEMLEAGADYSLICAVLEYTGKTARRPTWAYARAVILKKIQEGILDSVAFGESVAAWRGEHSGAAKAVPYRDGMYYVPGQKRVIEQQYGQREYDPKAYDGLSPDQLDEMARLEAAKEAK